MFHLKKRFNILNKTTPVELDYTLVYEKYIEKIFYVKLLQTKHSIYRLIEQFN